MLANIASFDSPNNPIRSAGHFIDKVAGVQRMKCIAHSTGMLNGQRGCKARAQELRSDTCTFCAVLPPQHLEQTHSLSEAQRNKAVGKYTLSAWIPTVPQVIT